MRSTICSTDPCQSDEQQHNQQTDASPIFYNWSNDAETFVKDLTATATSTRRDVDVTDAEH